jgi:hypothetical protein
VRSSEEADDIVENLRDVMSEFMVTNLDYRYSVIGSLPVVFLSQTCLDIGNSLV